MTEQEREAMIRRLWEWGNAMQACERRRREIKQLLDQAKDADNIKAQVITGMPHCSSVGDPTAAAAAMHEKTMQRVGKLTEEINGIMGRKAIMDEAVSILPEHQQRLLWMRYAQGWTLTIDVPKMMYVSSRTARYWHEAALKKIATYCHIF